MLAAPQPCTIEPTSVSSIHAELNRRSFDHQWILAANAAAHLPGLFYYRAASLASVMQHNMHRAATTGKTYTPMGEKNVEHIMHSATWRVVADAHGFQHVLAHGRSAAVLPDF
jgi:hypothetical protein